MVRCTVDGGGSLETIEAVQRFYELYPQGLGEKGEGGRFGYPLKATLRELYDPYPDLFIWMAKQHPQAVYDDFGDGDSMLHEICSKLAMEKDTSASYRRPKPFSCTPGMAKICRFLISEHPRLIRQKADDGCLPIHILAQRCNRPIVQDIVILLLKMYPDCVLEKAGRYYPELSTIPFIRLVYWPILEELEIDEEMALLAETSHNMAEAAALQSTHFTSSATPSETVLRSSLFDCLSGVFCSWANLRVSGLSALKQRMQNGIAEVCRIFEGDDVPEVLVDDDDWDEEDIDIPGEVNGEEQLNEEVDDAHVEVDEGMARNEALDFVNEDEHDDPSGIEKQDGLDNECAFEIENIENEEGSAPNDIDTSEDEVDQNEVRALGVENVGERKRKR